ncbi:GIY-YIG nuclease family protein [Phycisphaera mikurensis]|uniref:GIY-YIG domain-containing protein n=1 Tax=Phycisphaera mikurensis (strain NBRC 102666 / KCTC 22515 / FYK2301M01) TaxID=1142394 RepID=I0IAB4_PHYMF|nr:hypothetical protein [Phycisphaera mikurensis]MBB6441798.1 putative GIY-YIG superfamily endonuclease [Phycisphaera mikurensis]BAM02202.1 hypothetical protein PSMK_00430 [Phycisphaera mikurensis NBRC 102666]
MNLSGESRRALLRLLLAAVLLAAPARAGEAVAIEVDVALVRQAFVEVHAGHSADEVVVQEGLNAAFLNACARLHRRSADRLGEAKIVAFTTACNRALLNLRKAGGLRGEDARTTRRHADREGAPPPDAYRHAAEIAARRVTDAHAATLDDVLCDPTLRAAFAAEGHALAGPVEGLRDEDLRRAALTLRKSRRLRPELVVRVADWGRTMGDAPAGELAAAFAGSEEPVPAAPGVYLLADGGGYLYIGEALDLAARLRQHLDESDRTALRHHLLENGLAGVTVEWHAFDPASDARLARYRRAYESDLIASRRPRFNVRP